MIWDFTVEDWSNYECAGLISANSGKTNSAAVEVARCVSRKDPYNKYPKSGDIYIVSEQWGEIGRVIYPKLFKAGAFKAIKDHETKEYRAFNPTTDADRAADAVPAGPLIPKRLLAKPIAWHDKKLEQPERIELTTGWTIHFFSGESKPPSGSAIDLAWLDEEITRAEWFVELNSRVAERDGKIMWTATPEVGTDQFHDYCTQAEDQLILPAHERDIEQWHLTLADNPHLTEKAKAGMASMLTDVDYEVRILGNFAGAGRVIFPEYSARTHCIDRFEVPKTWTRYLSVDPGHTICAVLFAAVPNPQDMVMGGPWGSEPFEMVLYDELYIPKCTAVKLAEAMRKKTEHDDFEDFVIDMHGARQTQMASGVTVIDEYQREIEAAGVVCRRRQSRFVGGNPDTKGGIEACRRYLAPDPHTGAPRIRIMGHRGDNGIIKPLLDKLDWEMKHWKNKTVRGQVTEEPETKGRVHQVANLRYLCSMNPQYVPQVYRRNSPLQDQLEMLKRKQDMMFPRPSQPLTFAPAGG